jgi:2-polyprenyl-3-methyl-5-hydroxy-6-metoxy-1,4-benzoquinol methylase
MLPQYKDNYDLYLQDQLTRFESFEGELYAEGIKRTIDHIFPIGSTGWRILDVCCGDGTTSDLLFKKGFGVTAFDGNERKIERAINNKTWGISFFVCEINDILQALPSQQYDIIYASHCFEHFLYPMIILKMMKKHLLLPGGEIILVLPYPNEDSEGHPGANDLKLNADVSDIFDNFRNFGFSVTSIERVHYREPEIIIRLK